MQKKSRRQVGTLFVLVVMLALFSFRPAPRRVLPVADVPILGMPSAMSSRWVSFKKPPEAELRAKLTPLQFSVTQEEDTEYPFDNEYDKNSGEGIYVDRVSGEPLFSSKDKYDSGTGWPSFVKPISPDSLVLVEDRLLVVMRTEVRSRFANSHLGHVFDDGPQGRGGKRYCMNSAALRFIPKADMVHEGYGDYLRVLD